MAEQKDDGLLDAAVAAALYLDAVYQWLDRVEAAGGATSIEGVAVCHAFLKSLSNNRERAARLVMEPLKRRIELAKEQKQ